MRECISAGLLARWHVALIEIKAQPHRLLTPHVSTAESVAASAGFKARQSGRRGSGVNCHRKRDKDVFAWSFSVLSKVNVGILVVI